MRGSWAGAFGPTQFMPTAFKRFAVDGDGDGRRDVVDNPTDLIFSTANNLKKDGWQSGQTWGYEVVAATGLQLHAGRQGQGDDAAAMGAAWPQAGEQPAVPAHLTEKAYLLAPAGSQGPGFLMLHEFPRHHEIQSG